MKSSSTRARHCLIEDQVIIMFRMIHVYRIDTVDNKKCLYMSYMTKNKWIRFYIFIVPITLHCPFPRRTVCYITLSREFVQTCHITLKISSIHLLTSRGRHEDLST